MRFSQGARRSLAALAGAALVAGCSATITGKPAAISGPPASAPALPVSPSTPPAGAIPLHTDQNGYVFVETKSGQTRCQIDNNSVGCEAAFRNSPLQDGEHANGIHITANGSVQWVLGNLGSIPTIPIDYQTYTAAGWVIVAAEDGTRFTNSATGHGMFISLEKVNTF